MSIVEVAKCAGVSKSTVSRVINQAPGVAEPLRKAVLEAMEQLQYQPSPRRPGPKPASRRGIRAGNVLLLMAGFEASAAYQMPVFPAILHGAEKALAQDGMNLVLAGRHKDQPIPTSLRSGQVDGVLLLGTIEEVEATVAQGIVGVPMVVVLRSVEEVPGNHDRVTYNNRAVGPLAAEYLLNRGHQHAAFVSGVANHSAFEVRQRLFRRAMNAGGGTVMEFSATENRADRLAKIDAFVQKLKRASPAVTAACVANDASLPDLYRAFANHGIEPQKDIDLVSCDNEQALLSTLPVRPATIDIRAELMGRLAIRQLRWRLAHPEDGDGPVTIVVEPRLIPGESWPSTGDA